MSSILGQSQKALRHAWAIYQPLSRHRQEAALQAFLAATIFAFLAMGLLSGCIIGLDLLPEGYGDDLVQVIYLVAFVSAELGLRSFILLGLFPYIKAEGSGVLHAGPAALGRQFAALRSRDWSLFMTGSLLLFAFQLVLFKPLLVHTNNFPAVFGSWDLPGNMEVSTGERMLSWATDLTGQLLHIVPPILLFFMIKASYGAPVGLAMLRSAWKELGALLVCMFLFFSVFDNVLFLLYRHLFPLLVIPFPGSALPVAMAYMSVLLLGMYATPFLATCVHYLASIEDPDDPLDEQWSAAPGSR